jgi:transcriptional regulator with XRE-family HTH domain
MAKMNHGQRLKSFREAAGMSQRELARRINVTYSNVSFWESTDTIPRSDLLVPIADVLGVTVQDLLGETTAKRRQPASKLGSAFEQAAKLPRRQQQRLAEFVQVFIEQNQRVAGTTNVQ